MAAAGAALAVAPTLALAAPHTQPHADPSISSVQKQLGELAVQNTQLVEKFDQAQTAVLARDKQASAAEAAALRANAAYDRAHAAFSTIIAAQYEAGSFGAAGALLDSSSGNNYLQRIQDLSMVSTHTAQVVDEVTQARSTASAAAHTAQQLLTRARTQRDALASQRKKVQAQISKYETLLSTLNSAQQADYRRATNPTVNTANMTLTKATSAQAAIAVQFAIHQVGKPYVFAASGPGAYDCSGLTMRAWEQAGVSLPHSAADQYNYGHHVSRDQLEPGDLIFFYQPIGHVTIYIGNGLMVSAPTEGEDVSVVPLSAFNSDYTGATRLVG